MNYNIIRKILFNIIVGAVLCNYCIYAQECSEGFTYFENIPENINNINNDSNCFSDDDLIVLDNFISINFCILGKNSLDEKSVTEYGSPKLFTRSGSKHFFEFILKTTIDS